MESVLDPVPISDDTALLGGTAPKGVVIWG